MLKLSKQERDYVTQIQATIFDAVVTVNRFPGYIAVKESEQAVGIVNKITALVIELNENSPKGIRDLLWQNWWDELCSAVDVIGQEHTDVIAGTLFTQAKSALPKLEHLFGEINASIAPSTDNSVQSYSTDEAFGVLSAQPVSGQQSTSASDTADLASVLMWFEQADGIFKLAHTPAEFFRLSDTDQSLFIASMYYGMSSILTYRNVYEVFDAMANARWFDWTFQHIEKFETRSGTKFQVNMSSDTVFNLFKHTLEQVLTILQTYISIKKATVNSPTYGRTAFGFDSALYERQSREAMEMLECARAALHLVEGVSTFEQYCALSREGKAQFYVYVWETLSHAGTLTGDTLSTGQPATFRDASWFNELYEYVMNCPEYQDNWHNGFPTSETFLRARYGMRKVVNILGGIIVDGAGTDSTPKKLTGGIRSISFQ